MSFKNYKSPHDNFNCLCQNVLQLKSSKLPCGSGNLWAYFLNESDRRNGWPFSQVWQNIHPLVLGQVREMFMASESLFILFLLPPVWSKSISRDSERESETEDKSSGERQRERKHKDVADCGDLFMLLVGLWPHAGRQMLMASSRNLLCDCVAPRWIL